MRLKQLAYVVAIAALAAAVVGCGSSSSSKKATKSGTTSSQTAAATKSQAKAALGKWLALTPKINAAFTTYGSKEPADVRAHSLLGERRDAYNLRNAVYRFDLGVRKVSFPSSMQTEVNSVLDTTKALVAALDTMSQSSKAAGIDRGVLRANAQLRPLEERTNAINVELHRLAGVPLKTAAASGGGGSDVSRVAAGLLKDPSKSGAKGQADATCAAKLMVKKLKKADIDKLAAGQIPQSGPLSAEVGATLFACQATSG